ncbi:hypothetical protein ABZ532_28225, partial [Streptomyces sp. NPDC019396]|uniref:hypothetical protein n=1 Tax=Streptomyces sp. NPDC019396 TaxID=3154687 RepID=UPI0033C00DA8
AAPDTASSANASCSADNRTRAITSYENLVRARRFVESATGRSAGPLSVLPDAANAGEAPTARMAARIVPTAVFRTERFMWIPFMGDAEAFLGRTVPLSKCNGGS